MRKLKGIIINGEYLGNKVAYSGLFKAIYCISPIIIAEFIKLVSDYGTRYAPLRITGFDLPEDHRILIRFANKKCRGYADLSFVVENYKLKLVDSNVEVESLISEKSVVEEAVETQDDIAQEVFEPEVKEPELEQDIEAVVEDKTDEEVETIEEVPEVVEELEEIPSEESVKEVQEASKEPEAVAVVVPMPEAQEETVEEVVDETVEGIKDVTPEEPAENNEDEKFSDDPAESIEEEQAPVDEPAAQEDCETEEGVVDDNISNELQEEPTNEEGSDEILDDAENNISEVSNATEQDSVEEIIDQQANAQNSDESNDDNSEGVQDFNEEFDETNENLLDECSENFADVENSGVEDSIDNNKSDSFANDEQRIQSEDYIESEISTVPDDVYDYTENNQNSVSENNEISMNTSYDLDNNEDNSVGSISTEQEYAHCDTSNEKTTDIETPSGIKSDCETKYDEIVDENEQNFVDGENSPIEVRKIVYMESETNEDNKQIKTIEAARLAPETLAEIQDMLSAGIKKKESSKVENDTNKKSHDSIKMVAFSRKREFKPFKMFQKGERTEVVVLDENSFLVGDTIYRWGDVFYVDG